MTYTRPVHGSPFADGSATDATVIIDELSDGLEAVEEKLDGSTEFGLGLLTLTDAAAGRDALDLVPGTDVQAHDADLDTIAGQTNAPFGLSLLTPASAAAGRILLGAGPLDKVRLGRRWVFLGDSETANGDDYTNGRAGDSWPNLLSIASGGSIQYVFNAGVSGSNTADQISRFPSQVAPLAPDVVTLLPGTADISAGVALATIKANVATLVGLVRGIGAVPIIVSTLPRGDDSTRRQNQRALNDWLTYYAESNGILFVDIYTPFVDSSNGNIIAPYADGTAYHLTAAGRAIVASTVWTKVQPYVVPGFRACLAAMATDGINLMPGALFATDSSGVPTGYTTANSGGTGTFSCFAADAPDLGRWSKIVPGTTVSGGYQVKSPSINVTAGDVMRFSCRIKSHVVNGFATVYAVATGSSVHGRFMDTCTVDVDGIVDRVFTVPSGATSYQIVWLFTSSSGTPDGYVQVAQPRLIKLS